MLYVINVNGYSCSNDEVLINLVGYRRPVL